MGSDDIAYIAWTGIQARSDLGYRGRRRVIESSFFIFLSIFLRFSNLNDGIIRSQKRGLNVQKNERRTQRRQDEGIRTCLKDEEDAKSGGLMVGRSFFILVECRF